MISLGIKVTFDDMIFVLDQQLDLNSANSLKQHSPLLLLNTACVAEMEQIVIVFDLA